MEIRAFTSLIKALLLNWPVKRRRDIALIQPCVLGQVPRDGIYELVIRMNLAEGSIFIHGRNVDAAATSGEEAGDE